MARDAHVILGPMSRPLLRTKNFIPPLIPKYVARPRLIDKLNQGLPARLTLLAAPAGFGKTTLVSAWIHQMAGEGKAGAGLVHPTNVAWLSLDKRDNEPAQFWGYVAAAFETIDPVLAEGLASMLDAPQAPPLEALVTQLINNLAQVQQSILLVLDDYHAISSESIHESLNYLLDYQPPTLHVVITTRADPPLQLVQRQARSELTQIRAADLAFSREEALEFLNTVMDLNLSPEDIGALENRTEGWITGLQLAALSLQEQPDKHQFVIDFTGDDRYIADYLVDEVLDAQSKGMQDFLLRTSILDRLCAPLCDAVTGSQDSRSMLAEMEGSNLFLTPLDNQRRWYRYHQLFADLLRQHLKAAFALAEINQLHVRASDWYEQGGRMIDAIDHAREAGDHQRVADLVETHAQTVFEQLRLKTLVNWIQSLPPEFVATRPKLNLIHAWALVATGQFEGAEGALRSIETNLHTDAGAITADTWKDHDPLVRGALAEALVIRGVIAINEFNIPRAIELSHQVLPCLADSSQDFLFNEPIHLKTVVAFNLGLAHELSGEKDLAVTHLSEAVELSLEQSNINILPAALAHLAQVQLLGGQLRKAEATYRRALKLASERSGWPSPLAGLAEIGMGAICYEKNELHEAQAYLRAGIDLVERWNHAEGLTAGYNALALLLQAQGEDARAIEVLEELIEILQKLQARVFLPAVEARRARLHIMQGELPAAEQWSVSSKLTLDGELTFLQEAEALTFARLLIAQRRWEDAQRYIARLLDFAKAGGRGGRVLELSLLQALVWAGKADNAQAQETLLEVIEQARPEGYVRIFVDEGSPMAKLLLGLPESHRSEPYIQKLISAYTVNEMQPALSADAKDGLGEKLVEALSERELEILACLAEGLTNREIGQRLSISLPTVKTHTRNIYGKLHVNNRTRAVAQARAWGLLP